MGQQTWDSGQTHRTLVPTEIAVTKVLAFPWASSVSPNSPGQQQGGQVTQAHTHSGCIPEEEPWIQGTRMFSNEQLACCSLLQGGRPSVHSKALYCTDVLEQIGQNKCSQRTYLQNRQECKTLMENYLPTWYKHFNYFSYKWETLSLERT